MNLKKDLREDAEFGLAGWSGRSLGMGTAHRHRDLEINYVLAGRMTYLVGGKIVTLPLRRLCLLWGGVPHQMIRGAQAVEAIWITIPLTTVLRWSLPQQLLHPLLTSGLLEDTAPHPGDLLLLQEWLKDLPDPAGRGNAQGWSESEAGRIVLLEIEARLRRLARCLAAEPSLLASVGVNPQNEQKEHLPPTDRLAAVEAMAQFICRQFRDEDICVAQIASAVYLHPNYAMTVFRRHTGMTLSQYLVLQRIAHAQRLLATTDDAIEGIAADSGFGSLSRFYEAFRQYTGNSPRRFRLQAAPSLFAP